MTSAPRGTQTPRRRRRGGQIRSEWQSDPDITDIDEMDLPTTGRRIRLIHCHAETPCMPQTYGCADYVIRDVWRIEAGWDRNMTTVHPATRRAELARGGELRRYGR